jgi:hypothetical protein
VARLYEVVVWFTHMTRFERSGMICCGWLFMLVGGLLCCRYFMGELTTGVEPPSGSDSQIAIKRSTQLPCTYNT